MKHAVRNDPVLCYLLSPGELRLDATRLRHRLEVLEQCLPPDEAPDRDTALARLSQLRRCCDEKQQAAEQREEEVSAFIDSLPTAAERTILRLRYCEGLRWMPGRAGHPCVFHAMHDTGLYYSERQMYRLHHQALTNARQLFDAGQSLPASA